jgi:hypothetical protein
MSIPRQAVQRLEVRRGGEHHRAGVFAGAATAFALGYLVGYHAEKDCSGWCMPELAGAGLGILLVIPGAAAGAALTGGRWEPASMESVRVGFALTPRGGTAAVTIRF